MSSGTIVKHFKLWHREFWQMLVANLFLTMSVYMLIPVLPLWLSAEENFSNVETGLSIGIFGVGIFTFGCICSWLVEKYRRNQVCLLAMVSQSLLLLLLYYFDSLKSEFVGTGVIMLQRFALGAAFGLAQMILSSTLIIDTSESDRRTEANYAMAWFGRFALATGPFAAIVLSHFYGYAYTFLAAAGCSGIAIILVAAVNFPFRAPEESLHVISNDRFLLHGGTVLFVNMFLVSTVVGLLLTLPLNAEFYAMTLAGFALAVIAKLVVFRDAELKSEVVSGLLLLIASVLVMFNANVSDRSYVAPLLFGLGIGLIGSRFILFFIKVSRHCRRGTSQSMYMLSWESGLSFGLCIGYALFAGNCYGVLLCSLAATVSALLMYNLYTHKWFIRNRNR